MTMENSGDRKTGPATENIQPPTQAGVRNPSRRRFNRAGVGASAVVLTLASRSVLADTVCKSPSGFDSLAPSMAANVQNSCTGRPVSQWLLQDPWPIAKDVPFASIFGPGYPGLYAGSAAATGAVNATTSLNAGKSWFEPFGSSSTGSASGSSNSAGNGNGNGNGNANGVVKATSNDNNELLLKDATLFQAMAGSRTPVLVKNLIAALLNFKAGYNSFPRDTDVVRIFQEWQQKGYYEVRATVKWYDPEINRYLASTNSVG